MKCVLYKTSFVKESVSHGSYASIFGTEKAAWQVSFKQSKPTE
jgi:hypothetical protein